MKDGEAKYYMDIMNEMFKSKGADLSVKIGICGAYMQLTIEDVVEDGSIPREVAMQNLTQTFESIKADIQKVHAPEDN